MRSYKKASRRKSIKRSVRRSNRKTSRKSVRRSGRKSVRRSGKKSVRRRYAPKMAIGIGTKLFKTKSDMYPFFNGFRWTFFDEEPTYLCSSRINKKDPVYSQYKVYQDTDVNRDGKTSNLYFFRFDNIKSQNKDVRVWAFSVVAKSYEEAIELIKNFEKSSEFPKSFFDLSKDRQAQIRESFTSYPLEKGYESKIIEFSYKNNVEEDVFPEYGRLVKENNIPIYSVYGVDRKYFGEFKL